MSEEELTGCVVASLSTDTAVLDYHVAMVEGVIQASVQLLPSARSDWYEHRKRIKAAADRSLRSQGSNAVLKLLVDLSAS